jgi:hypothetical protein
MAHLLMVLKVEVCCILSLLVLVASVVVLVVVVVVVVPCVFGSETSECGAVSVLPQM